MTGNYVLCPCCVKRWGCTLSVIVNIFASYRQPPGKISSKHKRYLSYTASGYFFKTARLRFWTCACCSVQIRFDYYILADENKYVWMRFFGTWYEHSTCSSKTDAYIRANSPSPATTHAWRLTFKLLFTYSCIKYPSWLPPLLTVHACGVRNHQGVSTRGLSRYDARPCGHDWLSLQMQFCRKQSTINLLVWDRFDMHLNRYFQIVSGTPHMLIAKKLKLWLIDLYTWWQGLSEGMPQKLWLITCWGTASSDLYWARKKPGVLGLASLNGFSEF